MTSELVPNDVSRAFIDDDGNHIGRDKGTPNKRNGKSIEKLKDQIRRCLKRNKLPQSYNPVVAMALCAITTDDPELAFKCNKEVATYLHAKRKSVEISSPVGTGVTFIIEGR